MQAIAIHITKGGHMNILVHSKTLQVTDAIRQYVAKQVRKIGKFSRKVSAVNVFLEVVKTKAGVEQEAVAKIQVMIPGKDVMTKSKAHDLYLAIHNAIEDAGHSMRKRKEKWMDRRAHKLHHQLRSFEKHFGSDLVGS